MRSVVVVLPASMWAMMPMLRTFFRSVSTSSATVSYPLVCGSSGTGPENRLQPAPDPRTAPGVTRSRPSASPAVVRECLVGLGHLVHVLAALDRGTEAVRGVEDLVHETLGHRLLTAGPREVGEPAQRESRGARRAHLDRDLVGRTADAAGADLEGRTDVLERALED